MNFEEKHILFLPNIKLNDYEDIDELLQQKLYNSINVTTQKDIVIYDKLPTKFRKIEDWVTKTNIKCWYCDFTFKNSPKFIPNYMSNDDKGQYIEVYGNFCSFGCAAGFLENNYKLSDDEYWEKKELLKILYSYFYKKKINDIKCSHSKYKLNHYGGNQTIKEYKQHIKYIENININNSY